MGLSSWHSPKVHYLQIVSFMDILVRREYIPHHYEMDFPTTRQFDSVKAIVSAEKSIGVVDNVL